MTEPFRPLPQSKPRICVIGDLMLDRYTWGGVSRISPEAPIPVLAANQDEVRPGGAAYVGALLSSLGCEVHLTGVIGPDSEAKCLRAILTDQKVPLDGLFVSEDNRPTTCKHRYMGQAADRHAQQILRVDREKTASITDITVKKICRFLKSALPVSDAVVVSDYGKGVVCPPLLEFIRQECNLRDLPLLVDPIPGKPLETYAGATLLKPNRREAELFLGQSLHAFSSYEAAAAELLRQAGTTSLAMTLDHEGIVIADAHSAKHIPTSQHKVYDITGAGDVVISVLALGMAAGWDLAYSSTVANVAAGLAVEKLGAELISWDEVHAAWTRQSQTSASKIQTLDEVAAFAMDARRKGQTIVFTNGCFDLLHAGHLSTLEEASRLGDVLIVAVNSDRSVAKLKGPSRPIQSQLDRARMLAGLACVSQVVVFDAPTPIGLLQTIHPDVLVKGGTTGEIVGRDIVEAYGGRVVQASMVGGISTTELIRRMDDREEPLRHPHGRKTEATHEIH